jgi:hypothetical protein
MDALVKSQLPEVKQRSRLRLTGHTGIYKTPRGKFKTYVCIAGWTIPLGSFYSIDAAIAERDAAIKKKEEILTELQSLALHKIQIQFNQTFPKARKRYKSRWG